VQLTLVVENLAEGMEETKTLFTSGYCIQAATKHDQPLIYPGFAFPLTHIALKLLLPMAFPLAPPRLPFPFFLGPSADLLSSVPLPWLKNCNELIALRRSPFEVTAMS
jgi:hypothetical protein